MDYEYSLRDANGPVQQKRIDTLVQKRDAVDRTFKEINKTVVKDHCSLPGARKRKSLCDLTPTDIVQILHSVNVDLLSYKQAADLHGVKPALVASVMG